MDNKEEFKIKLKPIDEQKKIVEEIRRLEQKVEDAQRELDEYKSRAFN